MSRRKRSQRNLPYSKKYELYTPIKMESMTEAQIRAEYSRLRSVGNKRLQRLEAAGIGMSALKGYRFPTIAQIESSSKSTVASELASLSRWLGDYRSTLTGERQFLQEFRDMIRSKADGQYASLVETTKGTYDLIGLLDDLRERYKNDLLRYQFGLTDTDIMDALQQAQRLNMPVEALKQHINLFVANMDKLEKVQPTKGGRTFSSSRVNALVRKWTPKE